MMWPHLMVYENIVHRSHFLTTFTQSKYRPWIFSLFKKELWKYPCRMNKRMKKVSMFCFFRNMDSTMFLYGKCMVKCYMNLFGNLRYNSSSSIVKNTIIERCWKLIEYIFRFILSFWNFYQKENSIGTLFQQISPSKLFFTERAC